MAALKANDYAHNREYVQIWDSSREFPTPQNMQEPRIITHVSVSKAQADGYHFLLEAAIAQHKDKLYMCWANHRKIEEKNNRDNLIRGSVSEDGLRWSEAEAWIEPPLAGSNTFNHPLLFSHNGVLYAFIAAWYDDRPSTHIFTLDDASGKWELHESSMIEGFVPFCAPQKLDNGNWIISGSHFWTEAAVIISDGDDFLSWKMHDIPRSDNFELMFPESSIIKQDGKLTMICRPYENCHTNEQAPTAGAAESYDNGQTWTKLTHSNFPMTYSMPYAGRLSTGQNYLISNDLEDGRFLLSIALTDKNGGTFNRVYKIRHQQWPARRFFEGYNNGVTIGTQVGKATEWSYPKAVEFKGNLYIAYAQGKEDSAVSIIPIDVLQDDESC